MPLLLSQNITGDITVFLETFIGYFNTVTSNRVTALGACHPNPNDRAACHPTQDQDYVRFSITAFAGKIKERYGRVDILLNNAGVFP